MALTAGTVVLAGVQAIEQWNGPAGDIIVEPALTTPAAPNPAATEALTPAPPPPPPSAPVVPPAGPGTFTVAGGESAPAGAGGTLIAYRVEVEDGLPYAPVDFASAVDATLASGQGWSTKGYSFARRSDAPLRVVLASPATTDTLCAPLLTRGEVSCRNGDVVAINAKRWTEGAEAYGVDLDSYRTYVVNHEVGHALGRPHEQCPGPGALAPVMLQQTLGLDGCRPNPWP